MLFELILNKIDSSSDAVIRTLQKKQVCRAKGRVGLSGLPFLCGGRDLPPMIKRKKRGNSVVVQCLQGKRSTVLALSRTLCADCAGAAALAAASCVSDMSDSFGGESPLCCTDQHPGAVIPVIKPAIACTSANECHASGVHPEAYPVVRRILAATKSNLEPLIGDTPVLHQLQPEAFTDAVFGVPTVTDILHEVDKPGRDPRPVFKTVRFRDGVEKLEDLSPAWFSKVS